MQGSRERFSGKTVIVSGGADGMGAACVRRFAEEGAQVHALDKDLEKLERLASDLSAKGTSIRIALADVMEEEAFSAAIRKSIAEGDRVDVLVNVAGGSVLGLMREIEASEWDRIYRLNVRSTLVACQTVLPTMRAQESGSIVNMSSISGLGGDPGLGAYNAAKASIIALTKSLAWEEGRNGIRANAICPGTIASPRLMNALPEGMLPEFESRCALGRIGMPEEVAAAILFLASDEASFITGTTLVADGGMTAGTGNPRFF